MSARKLITTRLIESDFWSQLASMRAQNRMSQAMLLNAPRNTDWQPLLDRVLTPFWCTAIQMPCGICSGCLNVLQDNNPDIHYIRPETADGAIKIEQIRALQALTYQTPQIGKYQCVVIQPAEALNIAAASALLKILEEPSPSTLFILTSSAPSLLLPTILSRCQRFQIEAEQLEADPISLGRIYPEHSPRAILYEQRLNLLHDLDRLVSKQDTVCMVAQRWSEYALPDLLWFLQTVTVKLIHRCLLGPAILELEYQGYPLFAKAWRAEHLFALLDNIQAMTKKLQQNIPLNSDLALERVLLNYLEGSC